MFYTGTPNQFHVNTIRALTAQFASIKDRDVPNFAEKELWEYLVNLYKNSNKSTKGRGKGRKVSSKALNSASRVLRGEYSVYTGLEAGVQHETVVFDSKSQSDRHSTSVASIVGTSYKDTLWPS